MSPGGVSPLQRGACKRMYLLVFVTLVIGLIGIYGQILTAQTARVAASQTGFAQTMMDWHSAAVSMGGSVIKGASAPTDIIGCALTAFSPPSASVSPCQNTVCSGLGIVTDMTGSARYKIALDRTGPCAEDVHLSSSYKAEYYQFYSVLYAAASGARYVITWVAPPATSVTNPAPGYIALPTKYQTSLTMADLSQQFRNIAKASPYTYGFVKNSKLKVGGIKADAQTLDVSYDVPSYIPEGSIAVISSADGYY